MPFRPAPPAHRRNPPLCPTGQGFGDTWVNGRRMAEKGVPQGTGAHGPRSHLPPSQSRPFWPMRPSCCFRASGFLHSPRPSPEPAGLCPTGQGFHDTWVNGRRTAEKGVPQGTGSRCRHPAHHAAKDDSASPRVLAAVLALADFSMPLCHRRNPRACALRARVLATPGQTEAGWPKKVSHRVQAPTRLDPRHAGSGSVPARVSQLANPGAKNMPVFVVGHKDCQPSTSCTAPPPVRSHLLGSPVAPPDGTSASTLSSVEHATCASLSSGLGK